MGSEVDIEALVAPLDGEAPSGPDLEYDAEFMALERAVASRGERMVGSEDAEEDEPDWERVVPSAVALFERTRDLRVAVILCTAWLRTRGLPGWRDGLALVDAMLAQLWDSVHPQLDAEDDDDPTARVNALMPLADVQAALRYLRVTPFVRSARLGAFSLRDLRAASGNLKVPEGEPVPATSEIEACCLDCPEELLGENAGAVHAALEHARSIDTQLTERLSSRAPELRPLITDLYELDRFLQAQWNARTGAGEAGTEEEGAEGEGGGGGRVAGAPGRISSPADVVRRLDEICEYYARQEPSSPIPILLRRAQKLVGMGFEDLLRNLAPGGLSELQQVAGPTGEEQY